MEFHEAPDNGLATQPGTAEDALRLRAQTVPVGVGVTYAAVAILSAWVATTWSGPNRGLIAALLAFAMVTASVVWVLPRERIVRSRWREPFFFAWSMAYIVLITTIAAADGGARSPATYVYFLTLVFAALSYPLWLVAVVSCSSLAGFVGLAVLFRGRGAAEALTTASAWVFAACLALVGVMCILQARINAHHFARLGRLSRTDTLTGCLNRFGLSERLEAELRRARGDRPVGLVLLDLVGFKTVNDTLGHPAGDELLVWVSHALRQLLRPGDSVGRIGGDEFLLVLPGAEIDMAWEVAHRVSAALAERVQATPGAASSPRDGVEMASLIRVADERLYASRRESAPQDPAGSAH